MTTDLNNLIGDRLWAEIASYGLKHKHVATLLGVTSGAVHRWISNKNGATHQSMVQLAVIFRCSLNDLSNTGTYVAPVKPSTTNSGMVYWAKEALELIDGKVFSQVPEFRMDAKKRLREYLETMGVKSPAPRNTLMAIKLQDAMNAVKEPEPVVPAPAPVSKDNSEANQIRLFLHQANQFAQNNALTWVVREDGTLTAQRVTVEEF